MTAPTNPYFLSHGSHTTAAEGRCAMEWVAYLAGEEHSDSPRCVSRFLQRLGIALNDRLEDEPRQRLRPYLARMIGTAGDDRDEWRRQQVVDWYVRELAPLMMDAAGCQETAARLRQLPEGLALENARRVLGDVRKEAEQARSRALARLGASAADAASAAYAASAADAAYAASAADAASAAWLEEMRQRVYQAAYEAAEKRLKDTREQVLASLFGLLDRLLPTVPVELPVVEDADAVCAVA